MIRSSALAIRIPALVVLIGLVPLSAVADTLGENGERVDPFVFRVVDTTPESPGLCSVYLVTPMAEILSRCADDDGCTLRVMSSGAKRGQSNVHAFTIDSVGEEWTIDNADGTLNEGSTVDGVRRSVTAGTPDGDPGCGFESDSFANNSGNFYLLDCHDDPDLADSEGKHTCVVRFDD